MSERYRHIMNHPHHISLTHRHMSNAERAAQFGSFKALTGFEDGIAESARYVGEKQELTEMQLDALDAAFQRLPEQENPLITVTYFIPDAKKSGGVYAQYTGIFRFLDLQEGRMKFCGGMEIALDAVQNVRFAEDEDLY